VQPSRELAEQTQKEINNFMKYLNEPVIRTMLAAGGVPIKEQLSDLQKGVRPYKIRFTIFLITLRSEKSNLVRYPFQFFGNLLVLYFYLYYHYYGFLDDVYILRDKTTQKL